MLQRIGIMMAVVLIVFSTAMSTLAADELIGKVTKIEGDKVTVTIDGALPAWVKVGGNATAAGGAPKILAVKGKELVLRFSRAKAAKIKVDSSLILSEFTGDELQGC